MTSEDSSSFFRELLERRTNIFQMMVIGILLGIFTNIISEVIMKYVPPINYLQTCLLSLLSVICLLFLLSRMFFNNIMSRAFYSVILFNTKTGTFLDPSGLAFIGSIYWPMLHAGSACRELIREDSVIKDRILSGDINDLEDTFFQELAELLIVSWLNETTMVKFYPMGGLMKPSVEVKNLPMERYELNDIQGTFENNIFKNLETVSNILRLGHGRIPKGFKIITSRSGKIKTELNLEGSMFNPISFLSISFSTNAIGTGAPTILYMMGYTPRIIGSNEITCDEAVIKGDKLIEMQKWTEIRFIVDVKAKFNYKLLFLPSFKLYFQWVNNIFKDSDQHFNFNHYLEQIRSYSMRSAHS